MEKFKFKKKYGQNFITDENLINKIVNSAEINTESLVIEIGPGMGALTTKILDKCKQGIIYEIDTELKEYLEHKLNEEYTVHEIVTKLQEMKMLEHKGKGFEPTYTRNSLTDALHEYLGINTDTEILTYKKIKEIFNTHK